MNARPSFFLFLIIFCLLPQSVQSNDHATPEMHAVASFFTKVEQHPHQLPNLLDMPAEEVAHNAALLSSSMQRIVSLLAYHPDSQTYRLITKFFTVFTLLIGKHPFVTTPSSHGRLLWQHEVAHLRKKMESFSTHLEHRMASMPRNADLALQMAYDMSIVIMMVKKLFIPATFPRAPRLSEWSFAIRHSKKVQHRLAVILGGTSLLGIAAGVLHALRTERTRHRDTTDKLILHTTRHEKALNAFIKVFRPASNNPLTHAQEILVLVKDECTRLESTLQTTPVAPSELTNTPLNHQLYTKIKYLHTLYRFVGQDTQKVPLLRSEVTRALGALFDAEAGLPSNHMLATPAIQARVLLAANQRSPQAPTLLPTIQESPFKKIETLTQLRTQLGNLTEEDLQQKVSDAIKQLSDRAQINDSIETDIRTLQRLIEVHKPSCLKMPPEKTLFIAAIKSYNKTCAPQQNKQQRTSGAAKATAARLRKIT